VFTSRKDFFVFPIHVCRRIVFGVHTNWANPHINMYVFTYKIKHQFSLNIFMVFRVQALICVYTLIEHTRIHICVYIHVYICSYIRSISPPIMLAFRAHALYAQNWANPHVYICTYVQIKFSSNIFLYFVYTLCVSCTYTLGKPTFTWIHIHM